MMHLMDPSDFAWVGVDACTAYELTGGFGDRQKVFGFGLGASALYGLYHTKDQVNF